MTHTEQPAGELSLDDVIVRLIEMGHGTRAVPVIESAVAELVARGDASGFELDDLLAHLATAGEAEVAEWTREAAEYLQQHGVPLTDTGLVSGWVNGALKPGEWSAAPHVQIHADWNAAAGAGASRLPRLFTRKGGRPTLEELHFRLAHAFEGGREVRRSHYQPIAALVQPGEKVLDIGCGDGTFLDLVRDRGAHGIGIELDPAKVAHCRANGLTVLQGRVQDLTWGESDFVSMIQIIEHLTPTDALEILDRACQSLSDEGRLFIVTPNFANPFVAHSNFWLDVTHVRPYPPALLTQMAYALGFRHVESGTMGDNMDTWCYAYQNPAHRYR
jgi:2-polyprenyl-3-methyl-5-hydroxy-6-metoxy-1,4-benzoquinol methylase